MIDEVHIYAQPLRADQVVAVYNNQAQMIDVSNIPGSITIPAGHTIEPSMLQLATSAVGSQLSYKYSGLANTLPMESDPNSSGIFLLRVEVTDSSGNIARKNVTVVIVPK